jgi:hypothetical protein
MESVTRNGSMKLVAFTGHLLSSCVGRPVLVFASQGSGNEEPHQGERHVERSERRQHESQGCTTNCAFLVVVSPHRLISMFISRDGPESSQVETLKTAEGSRWERHARRIGTIHIPSCE